MQSGAVPSSAGGSTDDAATWAGVIVAACTETVVKLSSRRSRFAQTVSLHGGRRSMTLMRLSSGIVREVVETRLGDLSDSDERHLRALLEDATNRLRRRDGNGGWDALNAARRVAFGKFEHDDAARANLSIVMRAEVDNKLVGWRKDAALRLLPVDPPMAPNVDALRRAQAQLDENSANVFRRIDIFGSVLTFVLVGLVVVLAGLLLAVQQDWLPELEGTALETVTGMAAVMLLGALGSFLSVALTQITNEPQKLPAVIQGRLVDLLRPLIGAASAVAVVVIMSSGLEAAVESDGSKIYVWAIVAGFSERLLRRTLNALADSVEESPSPTTKTDGT